MFVSNDCREIRYDVGETFHTEDKGMRDCLPDQNGI
jgi:hypothetical protein